MAAIADGPKGFMVAAVNRLKRLDEDYLLFFQMMGEALAPVKMALPR